MTLEITNQTRIQKGKCYFYTVEDTHLDIGDGGCTISYWEVPTKQNSSEKRLSYVCMDVEEALAVADAIYKFFKLKSAPLHH